MHHMVYSASGALSCCVSTSHSSLKDVEKMCADKIIFQCNKIGISGFFPTPDEYIKINFSYRTFQALCHDVANLRLSDVANIPRLERLYSQMIECALSAGINEMVIQACPASFAKCKLDLKDNFNWVMDEFLQHMGEDMVALIHKVKKGNIRVKIILPAQKQLDETLVPSIKSYVDGFPHLEIKKGNSHLYIFHNKGFNGSEEMEACFKLKYPSSQVSSICFTEQNNLWEDKT